MPRITDIQAQKRHANYFSVFVDNVFCFSLTDLELSNSSLRIGDQLSAADIERWQQESASSKAYNQVLHYLSYRMRTRQEVSQYLERKGWDEPVVEAVTDRLQDNGLVDDKDFGTAWIANRNNLKPVSKRRLAMELRRKGLDSATAEEVLSQVSDEDQLEAIKAVVLKKRKLAKYADRQVLMRYLASQGFKFDLITAALEQLGD